MDERNTILILKQLSNSLDQYGREEMKHQDLTPSQSFILNYLLSQKGRELYATNIHMELGISKAAVSSLLKALRRNGYLRMESDPEDDRRKQITLSEKAYEVEKRIRESLKERQACLCRNISEQNLDMLETCLKRMIANIKPEIQGGIKHVKNVAEADRRI